MVSIHADCLLFDLRLMLSAVRQHNERLCSSPDLVQVQRLLEQRIEEIEDAASFIRALQAIGSEAQARLGEES